MQTFETQGKAQRTACKHIAVHGESAEDRRYTRISNELNNSTHVCTYHCAYKLALNLTHLQQ